MLQTIKFAFSEKLARLSILATESFEDREFGDWCERAYDYDGPEPPHSTLFPRAGLVRHMKGPLVSRYLYRYGQCMDWVSVKESDFKGLCPSNQIRIRQKIFEALSNCRSISPNQREFYNLTRQRIRQRILQQAPTIDSMTSTQKDDCFQGEKGVMV
jgi:hypothetical protein